MSETTTIQLHIETKDMLEKLKQHPRETYDDVISRLVTKSLKKSKEA